jgi:hypothetical protein
MHSVIGGFASEPPSLAVATQMGAPITSLQMKPDTHPFARQSPVRQLPSEPHTDPCGQSLGCVQLLPPVTQVPLESHTLPVGQSDVVRHARLVVALSSP